LLQNSMNLPPDKAQLLQDYDVEKKWELVCDQERFQVKNPPHTYIQQLKSHMEFSMARKQFKRRVQESTQVLREIEISLRTNHIGWVREFLNEENRGLDVLVDYLCHTQSSGTYDDAAAATTDSGATPSMAERQKSLDGAVDEDAEHESSGGGLTSAASSVSRAAKQLLLRHNTLNRRWTFRNQKAVSQDDVHVCIMCLRAIMNYQSGFNLVMSHPSCVNEITLSLNNRSPRTKALVLELLAAVCLVLGGHSKILAAFSNFKEVKQSCGEKNRFERLMEYFGTEDNNIDFMVACMQFINIVVHSVEDMNLRVHLQYEFTELGLDGVLESLKETESERLLMQIQAYLDNVFDVGALLEDAETRTAALEHVDSLEDQIASVTRHMEEKELEAMARIAELEKQLMHGASALNSIEGLYRDASSRIHELESLLKD
uniref:GBD/FH3 domain-containing protein n=1 Tax=Petromyzon marinus TaxID=7757 RepID=S4R8U6_PETMA